MKSILVALALTVATVVPAAAADKARASSAVMFLTSGYPDWAKAAFGSGEGSGGAAGGECQ